MADALERNKRGKIYAVEADADWAARTLAQMPPQLRARVEILVSPCRAGLQDYSLVHRFDSLPDFIMRARLKAL